MEDRFSGLKKGIIIVFIANLINLLISLVNGFVLPKFLSVEAYADIKTYQLYANYIGVAALGYSDGIYLKYGGKKITDINNSAISVSRSNLLVSQGIISAILIALSLIINDKILLITSISLIPVNLANNFKNIFQATGEFKSYSRILNYTSLLTFLGSMALLFVIKTDNALFYIGWSVLVTFLVWTLLESKLKTAYHYKCTFSVKMKDFFANVKSGILLMLGNFSSILMTSIDRWFVKALLTTVDFAYFSFVVSVVNLVAVFINPIVTTMYNFICTTMEFESIKKIKRMCLIFSLFLISSAYPVKFILEVYLNKYIESKYVLFILFSTEVLFILMKGIYVNVYKARKQQDIYFKQLVISIIIGCVLNGIFYILFRSNEGIAFATLLSVVSWYVMCCVTVKELKPDWKEILILIVSIPVFIVTGFFLPSIGGFCLYILTITILTGVLLKSDFYEMILMIKGMIKKKSKSQ